MKYLFRWGEDPRGDLDDGWIQEGVEGFDPTQAQGVAHDVIEHFPNGKGIVTDELLALGAWIWIKEQCGEGIGTPYYSHAQILNMNVCSIIQNYYTEKYEFGEYINTKTFIHERSEYDYIAEEAIKLTQDKIIIYLYEEDIFDDSTDIDATYLKNLVTQCYKWMRVGYMKARRRYPEYTCNPYFLMEEIERQLKYKSNCDVEVQVIISENRVNIKFIYEKEGSYYD